MPLVIAVEDEPRTAALLEAILARSGCRLLIAPDLAGARELLAEATPDLVLLDRHLPDGDGLDLIPEIRGSDRFGSVPIILVSTSVLPRDVQAAMAAGCDGFLPKPVHVKPLVEAVRRLLERETAVDA